MLEKIKKSEMALQLMLLVRVAALIYYGRLLFRHQRDA